MAFQPGCPQCNFVSRQLSRQVACLLHVELPVLTKELLDRAVQAGSPRTDDEPYETGFISPTTDAPGPFSLREYARLLVLRGKVREQRSAEHAPASSH